MSSTTTEIDGANKETLSLETLLRLYIDSLSEKETMAYNIAKQHLGTSFSLPKSNGFLEWKKRNYP